MHSSALRFCRSISLLGLVCFSLAAQAQTPLTAIEGDIPILGVTPSKNVGASLIQSTAQPPQAVNADPDGDTFSTAPVLQDAGSAYYPSASSPSTHTFNGTPENAGTNTYGTAGGYFSVTESHTDQGGGVERIIVEVTALSSGGSPEPWVDVSNAGTGLVAWRLDVGQTLGGSNKIDADSSFTVIDSGISLFNSAGGLLGTLGLNLDDSSGSELSGVGIGSVGGDIAGFDMATIQMYWDIQFGDVGTPEVAVTEVDVAEGTYAPGDQFLVAVSLENTGDGPSGSQSLSLYASTDTTITAGDTSLGSISVAVPAGETEQININTLPNALANGNWYIGAIYNIADGNTANNVNHDPTPIVVTSNPDIHVQPQSLSFSNVAPAAAAAIEMPELLISETTLAAQKQATLVSMPALLTKVGNGGDIRVIVGFDMPILAAGAMDSGTAQLQQAQISSVRSQVMAGLAGTNYTENRRYQTLPFVALTVDEEGLLELANSPLVASIQEDHLSRPYMASSNPVIGSPLAWAEGYDGSGVAVAVLDTGVDKTHPWFSTNGTVVSEACYSSNGTNIESFCPGGATSSVAAGSGDDCDPSITGCNHGTHVAGTVAGNDGSGPNYGVARGADIIAMQVFSKFTDAGDCGDDPAPCVRSFSSDQIKALERLLVLNATLDIAAANMSLGGGQYFNQGACDGVNAGVKAAIGNLRSVGVATVVAAGNDGYRDSIGAPACISNAISVGATTDQDTIASFSNIYPQLHLLAPGVDIVSSVQPATTASYQGTSMATPHVAGAWAVLKQANPSATVDQVLTALQTTAVPVDDLRSGGIETSMDRISLDLALGEGIERTTFGIFNRSPVALNVSSITKGTPAPWITVVPAGPFVVPANGLQTVEVQIDYGQAPEGESNTTLAINSNDPDENPFPGGVLITVSNTVIKGPEFDSLPPAGSTINLGSQNVGVKSGTQEIQVKNQGDEVLNLTCSISGTHDGDFNVESCAISVAAEGSTQVGVSCTPTAAGDRSGSLDIKTNDADEANVSYSLKCIGTEVPSEPLIFKDGFED